MIVNAQTYSWMKSLKEFCFEKCGSGIKSLWRQTENININAVYLETGRRHQIII